MQYHYQAPAPKVIVKRFNFNATVGSTGRFTEIVTFTKDNSMAIAMSGKGGVMLSNALQSYNFSESVKTLETTFAFNVVTEHDTEGNTWYDKIQVFDIVEIYEDGTNLSFIGVVDTRNFNARMTTSGVQKQQSFSGYCMGGIIQKLQMILDTKLFGYVKTEALSAALTNGLTKSDGTALTIKEFIDTTWKAFSEMSTKNDALKGVKSNIGILDIIDAYINFSVDSKYVFSYVVAQAWFEEGANTIIDIWKNMLPDPIYELYAKLSGKKYDVIAREAPFGDYENGKMVYDDWTALPRYKITPLELVDYDLTDTNKEVYTVFYAYLEGSILDPSRAAIAYSFEDGDKQLETAVNQEKFAKYGYRPLIVSFRGYSQQDPLGKKKKNQDQMEIMQQRMKAWYSNMDDQLDCAITIMNDLTKTTKPTAGGVLQFLGGEFYIPAITHSWSFNAPCQMALTLERGMKTDLKTPINNIGKQLREFEVESQKAVVK